MHLYCKTNMLLFQVDPFQRHVMLQIICVLDKIVFSCVTLQE